MRPSGYTEIRGSVGVEGWASGGVDIGVTDAWVLVSSGVTQNPTHTLYQTCRFPPKSEFAVVPKRHEVQNKRQTECVGWKRQNTKTQKRFHGAHRHTHVHTLVTKSGP